MKKILIIIPLMLLGVSCEEEVKGITYTQQTVDELNELKSPVILIGKDISFNMHSVSLRDGTGKVAYFGNMSGLANTIGASHVIGDTIK